MENLSKKSSPFTEEEVLDILKIKKTTLYAYTAQRLVTKAEVSQNAITWHSMKNIIKQRKGNEGRALRQKLSELKKDKAKEKMETVQFAAAGQFATKEELNKAILVTVQKLNDKLLKPIAENLTAAHQRIELLTCELNDVKNGLQDLESSLDRFMDKSAEDLVGHKAVKDLFGGCNASYYEQVTTPSTPDYNSDYGLQLFL